MVFENFFSAKKMKNSFWYSFLVASIASIIGIALSRFIFGANSGIAGIMFLTLILVFALGKLFSEQEAKEIKERKPRIKNFFKDNLGMIKTYAGIFVGVFFIYYMTSFFGVLMGFNVFSILKEQMLFDSGLIGKASGSTPLFWSILLNNWWVLVATFLLSIMIGSGGLFFVAWNASMWAAIFGYRAAASALVLNINPFITALTIQLITFPHTLFEGLAYVLASLAGAIISTYIIDTKRKTITFIVSFIILLTVMWTFSYFLKIMLSTAVFVIMMMLIFCAMMWLLKFIFDEDKHRQIYNYNFYLFLFAIIIFIIGVLIETQVIAGSSMLSKYYSAAYVYAAIN